MDAPLRRVAVIGSTGSGKSTLAETLASRLGVPHVEFDSFRWDPNWTETSNEVFRARVAEAVRGDAWVVDGNYSFARDLTWPRAQVVVWLDHSFGLIAWRLTRRICGRTFRREVLWNGNIETGWKHLFTKDSLYVWLVRSHWRRRRQLEELMTTGQYPHIRFVRLKSAREAREWLARVVFAEPPV